MHIHFLHICTWSLDRVKISIKIWIIGFRHGCNDWMNVQFLSASNLISYSHKVVCLKEPSKSTKNSVHKKKMIEWGKQLWIKQSYHLAFRGAVGDVNGNWLQVATKWKEWRDIRIMVNIFFSVFNYLWATILAWFLTNLPKKNQFELKTSTPNSYWHLFEI